jgi:predicted regulator of Ras-like GTPase activity (Roadblock/LC7/MglB family)
MFTLARRHNLIPFFLILGLGVSLTITLPPNLFPNQVFEIPTFALFFAEIALAFILSVLFFENASPAEAFRISFTILTIAMASGGLGNIVGRVSQGLPDSVLLLNWVQLIAMNITGLISAKAFLEIRYTDTVYPVKKEQVQEEEEEIIITSKIDQFPQPDNTATKAESAKEILGKLDIRRINSLEKSLKESNSASLEELFTEETTAPNQPQSPLVIPTTHPSALNSEPSSENKEKLFDDVSQSVDDAFANLAPEPAQKDFSPTEIKPETKISKDMKKFGRLSANITTSEPTSSGTLKTIGQMLLDSQAIENIIRQGELGQLHSSATNIVTVSDGANIQTTLNNICQLPNIVGSLIISQDGFLLGASENVTATKDILGPLALAIYSHTNVTTKQMELGELRQIVLTAPDNITILTEIQMGSRTNILAVLADSQNNFNIDQILVHIEQQLSEPGKESSDKTGEIKGESESTVLASTSLIEDKNLPDLTLQPEDIAKAIRTITEEDIRTIKEEPKPVVDTAKASDSGLFSITDDDVSSLFDNLINETSTDRKAPESKVTEKKEITTSSAKSLFDKPLTDDDMSDMFGNLLAEPEPIAAPTNFSPHPEPTAEIITEPINDAAASQMKEFGRLSQTAPSSSNTNSDKGTIKAIGKQLIDVQAVENIIKAGESPNKTKPGLTTARVISAARGEGIKTLLKQIDGFAGVSGSLIVGSDGLVIATTLADDSNKESLGALCNSMLSHSDLAVSKFDIGKLRQMIFFSDEMVTILTTVAVGVLAVFLESKQIDKLDNLLAIIDTTVKG